MIRKSRHHDYWGRYTTAEAEKVQKPRRGQADV